jgi:hypothetical protein
LSVIREIDSRAFQVLVFLFATVFKRDVISVQHDGIEYPVTLFALHMADYFGDVKLIELEMFPYEFVSVRHSEHSCVNGWPTCLEADDDMPIALPKYGVRVKTELIGLQPTNSSDDG